MFLGHLPERMFQNESRSKISVKFIKDNCCKLSEYSCGPNSFAVTSTVIRMFITGFI